MAVRQVVQWEPNPGRGNDMVGYMAEAKKIHEGLGWRVRAWQTIAAGISGPRVSYVLESDNMAAFLGSLEKGRTSEAWTGFVQRVLNSPTPSATQISSAITTEVPGLESGPLTAAPGSMMASVFQWQIRPGKLQEFLDLSRTEAKPLANAMGAALSVSTTNYAGAGTGIVSGVFLFDSIGEMTKFQEKAAVNTAWQALLKKGQAADFSATVIFSALVGEIPI